MRSRARLTRVYHSEMTPVIEQSVARTGPNADRWVLGSSLVCEKAAGGPDSVPADAVTHWHDDENTILYLRQRSADEPLDGDFEVAGVCLTLAATTSPRLKTVTGCGLNEPWLTDRAPQSHPSWRPRLLGPMPSSEALYAYMTKTSTKPSPQIDPLFHYYHADLGPTNILVSEDGTVAGIIDWESAAFFPRFFPRNPWLPGASTWNARLISPAFGASSWRKHSRNVAATSSNLENSMGGAGARHRVLWVSSKPPRLLMLRKCLWVLRTVSM